MYRFVVVDLRFSALTTIHDFIVTRIFNTIPTQQCKRTGGLHAYYNAASNGGHGGLTKAVIFNFRNGVRMFQKSQAIVVVRWKLYIKKKKLYFISTVFVSWEGAAR